MASGRNPDEIFTPKPIVITAKVRPIDIPYRPTNPFFSSPSGSALGPQLYSLPPGLVPQLAGALLRARSLVPVAPVVVRLDANPFPWYPPEYYTAEPRPRAFDHVLFARPEVPDAPAPRRLAPEPPVTEIYSGKALNDLIAYLAQLDPEAIRTADVALDPAVLRDINIAPVRGDGHVGLLKNGGKLTWPRLLSGDAYRPERDRLDRLARAAFEDALAGQADADRLIEIDRTLATLRRRLAGQAGGVTSGDYSQAKRFLDDFEAALSVLQSTDARECFRRQYAPRGRSVAELVRHMTADSLHFAPATASDEAAYRALYQELARCAGAAQAVALARR
jgi:hypothetical protein